MLLALLTSLVLTDAPPARFVVSFNSVCCGTDHAASGRLDAALAGSKAKVSGESWGKEGEFDVCVDLSSLSSAEREALMTKVKAALEKAKHVSFRPDAPCPKR